MTYIISMLLIPKGEEASVRLQADVDLPQITLPNSKKKIETRYVHFSGKKVYSRPQKAVVAAVVMKKAEPYQPMSCRLLNSSVILGMAVEMMVCAFG